MLSFPPELAAVSRAEVIRAWKAQGGRVAAVTPVHYPRALLRAFNFLPVEVWGPPRVEPVAGAAHVQPYICSVVRNALAFLLSGGLDATDLYLVPHACDSLQGLGSLLLDFVRPCQPVLTLYLPRGGGASGGEFLAAELRALYARLAELTGRRPADDELMQQIRADEEADRLLARLHAERARLPLASLDLYRLIRSREFLPAEAFAARASSVLAAAGEPRQATAAPLVLSGIVPEPMELFAALDEAGARVAADDFACCGRRVYPAGTSGEPFTRMAERILHAPPDSTRGSPIADRLAHLVWLTRAAGARGVVFYGVKFCEPELFYLPALREGLRREGIPSLTVEVDLNDGLSAPLRTRLEAFVEMLQ